VRNTCLASAFLVAALQGQQVLHGRDFLPPERTSEYGWDFAAMRSVGVWPEIERSPLQATLASIEQRGLRLAAVDRCLVCITVPRSVPNAESKQIQIIEGNAPLQLPTLPVPMIAEKIGEYTGQTPGHTIGPNPDPMVFIAVRPDLMVQGHRSLLEPPLTGKQSKAPAAPDLMSLLSGRGRNLIWLVYDLGDEGYRTSVLSPALAKAVWPEGDEPRFLMLRLCAIGDDKDPRLQVEAVLRHAKVGEGIAVSEAAVKQWLASLPKDELLGSLGKDWEQVVVTREHADLVARLQLGPPKDAAARIALLAHAMLPSEVRRPLAPPPDAGKKD
jgi:hypothetical protein